MTETLLPQLEDPEAREAVAEALMALFARWGLHEVNQAQLLGLSTVYQLKRKIVDAGSDTMERAGYLLAVDRALLKQFPSRPGKRDRWIFTGNVRLGGLTPLAVMLEKGVPGMILIKKLVESGG
jgi:hypothetical protein